LGRAPAIAVNASLIHRGVETLDWTLITHNSGPADLGSRALAHRAQLGSSAYSSPTQAPSESNETKSTAYLAPLHWSTPPRSARPAWATSRAHNRRSYGIVVVQVTTVVDVGLDPRPCTRTHTFALRLPASTPATRCRTTSIADHPRGSPKIWAILAYEGWRVSVNTVAAIMHEQGLKAPSKRRRKQTHPAGQRSVREPDLVGRDFGAD